jgi:hypothetical protein
MGWVGSVTLTAGLAVVPLMRGSAGSRPGGSLWLVAARPTPLRIFGGALNHRLLIGLLPNLHRHIEF